MHNVAIVNITSVKVDMQVFLLTLTQFTLGVRLGRETMLWSPTFLAPENDFMKDSFFLNGAKGMLVLFFK